MAPSGFTVHEQESWGAGMFRGRKAPADSVYDALNALVDDEGQLFRRGGSAFKTPADVPGDPLTGVWDLYTFGGQRTLMRNTEGGLGVLRVLGPDDATPFTVVRSSPGSQDVSPLPWTRMMGVGGYAVYRRPFFDGGISYLLYAGSRMPEYRLAGSESVTVTNGSKTVTGSGTSFLGSVDPGALVVLGDVAIVASVDSNTQLTLRDPWPGLTQTNTGGDVVTAPIAASVDLPNLVGLSPSNPFVLSAIAGVGSPPRLIAGVKNRLYFSVPGDPTTFLADHFHELPNSAVITGADAIRDTAVVFTAAGVWAISNMNFDPIDGVGNVQHQVAELSKDVILWGDAGIAGWGNQLLVPGIDDVYVFSLTEPPLSITGPRQSGVLGDIRAQYRSYVKAGFKPGLGQVYRGHYELPVLTAGNEHVDTLVCRLDRGFAWSHWGGHGGGQGGFAVRVGDVHRAPKLFATRDRRIIELTDAFAPSAANRNDADGTTHQTKIVTRDYDTGPGAQVSHVERARLTYELVDSPPPPATAPPSSVTFRGINNPDVVLGTGSFTAVIVDKPADTVDGDLILIQIEMYNTNPVNVQITVPAGFQQVPGGSVFSTGSTRRVVLYWKIAQGDPASWRFHFQGYAGTLTVRESAISYSGTDRAAPIEAVAVTATSVSSQSMTFPNVNTVSFDAKVLFWASTESNAIVGGFYGAVTFPGAERRDDDGILIADRFDTVTPGSYSIPTITGNAAADTYVLWTIAIREPPVPAVPFVQQSLTFGVVGRDLGAQQLDAVRQLGRPLNRQEFSLADNVAGGALDAGVTRAADLGIKILPLFGYGGTFPNQPQAAQWCADLAARYGPGGTFWDANPQYSSSLHMTHLEVGNESSYAHHPGTNNNPEAYAELVEAIGIAVQAANPGVGLLVQADDAGLPNNWINRMFVQVPNLGTFAAGWTLHAYGPPQDRLKRRMRDIDTKIRPHSTAPVWLTEYGIATCVRSNSTVKTLSDNFGWPTNLTYAQAATELGNVLAYIQAQWATRAENPLNVFVYYQNTDQAARDDASVDREDYFGLMQWDVFGSWLPKDELFSLWLNLMDPLFGAPTMFVSHAVGLEDSASTFDALVKGGRESDGTDYSVWRVGKRAERIRFVLQEVGPSARLIYRRLESFVRSTGRQ